jgi:hypothetical protein
MLDCRWLFSWILEVYEKGWEGKPYERIGIAVLRFSDEQILKDMEMWYGLFYLYENTPAPLKRELEVKKFNFQNYWYEDDLSFNCQNTNSQKKESQRNSLGKQVQIIWVLVLKRIESLILNCQNTKIPQKKSEFSEIRVQIQK